MNTTLHRRLRAAVVLLGANGSIASAKTATPSDPRITSWFVTPSAEYARLYENDAAKNAGTAVTTWSRGQGTQTTPSYAGVMQVVNASTRAFVGTGEQVLIPRFAVSGTGTVKLLLRAVGPTLGGFGVEGALADPQLTPFQSNSTIGTNDNWSSAANAAEIAAAAAQAGAFALASGSRDAAMLVSLAAGSDTVKVSGVGATTGTALVELYVVN